jgi:sulfotransferase family protein
VRLVNGSERDALPNLITIGAQKCGTTSLHYYLNQHPDIAMVRAKELNFFVSEGAWAKGLGWYAAQFDPAARIRGESSPSYTNYPRYDGVAERIHAVVPEAKLVYMVRDPLERMISQYLHEYTTGTENKPIENVLGESLGTHRYVTRSKYFLQLEQYLPFFDPAAILVVAQEELLHERAATMQRIFEFLDVEASFHHPNFERIKHLTRDRRRKTWAGKIVTSGIRTATRPLRPPRWLAWEAENYLVFPFARKVSRPVLPAILRERLVCELQNDANRLRELTGKEFPNWSV